MQTVAFDSGDFSRRKKADVKKETGFFTPLGVGVSINEKSEERFKSTYLSTCKKLAGEFQVPTKRVVYSHASLWKEIGHRKAVPFCDNVIKE